MGVDSLRSGSCINADSDSTYSGMFDADSNQTFTTDGNDTTFGQTAGRLTNKIFELNGDCPFPKELDSSKMVTIPLLTLKKADKQKHLSCEEFL